MSIEERVAKLEQTVIDMKDNLTKIVNVVENIRDNHLHSIEEKIDAMQIKFAYYAGGLTVLLFVGNLFLRFYK